MYLKNEATGEFQKHKGNTVTNKFIPEKYRHTERERAKAQPGENPKMRQDLSHQKTKKTRKSPIVAALRTS